MLSILIRRRVHTICFNSCNDYLPQRGCSTASYTPQRMYLYTVNSEMSARHFDDILIGVSACGRDLVDFGSVPMRENFVISVLTQFSHRSSCMLKRLDFHAAHMCLINQAFPDARLETHLFPTWLLHCT